jgi:hypothetical protein
VCAGCRYPEGALAVVLSRDKDKADTELAVGRGRVDIGIGEDAMAASVSEGLVCAH